jgi:hypothetical protein
MQATLSANVVLLLGKQMYNDLFDRWQAALERHATPDGRLPLGAIASFLVDDVPIMLFGMHILRISYSMNFLHVQERRWS